MTTAPAPVARMDAVIEDLFARAIRDARIIDSDECIHRIARNLERGCRRAAFDVCAREYRDPRATSGGGPILFRDAYSCRAYKVVDLLRGEDARELLLALAESRVDATKVAQMSIAEIAAICPSFLRAEREEVDLRRAQKTEQQTSALYRCKKCGESKTTVTERQLRCADEAPTLMISCVNCGYFWTQTG